MHDVSHESATCQIDAAERGSKWGNLALLFASLLFSLVLVEVAFRTFTGLPVFELTDWRKNQVVLKRVGDHAVVDPTLGWTLRPWISGDEFTTIDYGIRINFGEKTIRTGAVLAVGDSFTEGWDMDNDGTWPAYLEKMIHIPVVNGGVFGYGTDQIILRAEQLLPIVRPKILIVGFLEFDIFRAAHSDFGAPKPYFTLENSELQYHPPNPIESESQRGLLSKAGYELRDFFGYSAVADYLLRRLAPNFWYAGSQILYRRAKSDGAAITCALLDRLKRRVDADGIRMMLFMQYNEYLILGAERLSENARRVVACAKAVKIPVVDQFAPLRAIIAANPQKIRDYYFAEKNGFGHMKRAGNKHAAGLLVAALAKNKMLQAAR